MRTTPTRRACQSSLTEAAAGGGPSRLLLVVLDDVGVAHAGIVGVGTELALRPALPEEVPALVEHDLDVLQACGVPVGPLLTDRVLLVGERAELVEDRRVVHVSEAT